MKERRVKAVRIAEDTLAAWIGCGSEAALPDEHIHDLKVEHVLPDWPTRSFMVYVSSDSFEPVLEGKEIPVWNPNYKIVDCQKCGSGRGCR